MLGVMTRASRVATNVYQVLEVSNGKPVLFFHPKDFCGTLVELEEA